MALFAGCAVSSIDVLEKHETPRPFSKILVIYVDNDIDFAVFDSLTYRICLQPAFNDTASLTTRGNTETLLSDGLSAPRSEIFKATDFFGPDFNGYAEFTAQIDTLGIDAILLVHVHHYTFTRHDVPLPVYSKTLSPNVTATTSVNVSFGTANAAFACYLIKPHEYLPVWKAEVDTKGKGVNGKRVLKTKMIANLEKSLVTGGYLVPHRP